jgi:Zn-dependent protease
VTLTEPNQTQFDLSWRMFGIPVRIHPMFWLVGVFLGWNAARAWGMEYLAVFIACMLVSILVHELGHVFMGRVFGAQSHIVLYGFGGLAVGSLQVRGTWRRIAVLLAGPGAGFLLYGLTRLTLIVAGPSLASYLDPEARPNPVAETFVFLLWMNLVWNILNLVPIWPLDGGRVVGEILMRWMGEQGLRISLTISIILAVGLALAALFPDRIPVQIPYFTQRSVFAGILLLLLAADNVQALMQLNEQRRDL